MKKYLFVLLLNLSSAIFACNACLCHHWLDIIIVNGTDTSCHLYSQSLEDGITYTKQIPLNIQKGMQSEPYSFMDKAKINVSLSFQCGDDRFVTVQSQRIYEQGFFSNGEKLAGLVTSSSNLDAVYSSKASECNATKPAVIYWTLQ